jgi:hypothetical protein
MGEGAVSGAGEEAAGDSCSLCAIVSLHRFQGFIFYYALEPEKLTKPGSAKLEHLAYLCYTEVMRLSSFS